MATPMRKRTRSPPHPRSGAGEQSRIEAVLESVADGLVIFSHDARVESFNTAAERQLGLDSRTLGHPLPASIDHDIAEQVLALLEHGAAAEAAPREISIERDGDVHTITCALHRFVDSDRQVPGVVMVLRDITAQREFDKLCSEFVLRASHELRTPIASVRMGLGLLGEKLDLPAASRDRELYETVQHEVSRMVDLLNDLLDLSRLRIGEPGLERKPEDVGVLIEGARQRFAEAAQDAGVSLRLDVESGLPLLPLCRRSFDRVFDNLINNSLRHTPNGGSITLSAHREPRRIILAVTDTGEGIPHANQAAIFQPFARFGSKRGAGLGLAICQEIVRQHGGEIKVSSQPNRGAKFTINLPIMN